MKLTNREWHTMCHVLDTRSYRYIVEGDYFSLETAIEDIEFLEKTVKDIETLFESNPIYN